MVLRWGFGWKSFFKEVFLGESGEGGEEGW